MSSTELNFIPIEGSGGGDYVYEETTKCLFFLKTREDNGTLRYRCFHKTCKGSAKKLRGILSFVNQNHSDHDNHENDFLKLFARKEMSERSQNTTFNIHQKYKKVLEVLK
jgi:uncharacterized UPF0160 family protein